jgi:drug/metabolite transporter (DMT)-like permease
MIWLTPALWTVNFIIARRAPGVVDPHVLALGRWAIAGLILGLAARSELWRERQHLRARWSQYLVLGTLGMLVCGAWVYLGARTTGAMNMALIYATSPVLISLGAVLWLGERMRWVQRLGVVLAIAGVVHVVVKGQWAALGDLRLVAGDGWMVLATLSWAGFALLQKRWSSPLGPTGHLAAMCAGGCVVLLPFAYWELLQPQAPGWSAQAMLLVAMAALIPGLGAYWIYGWSQRVLGASRVAVTLYLAPLYSALAAWGLLNEPLGIHHLVGALLILPGVFLVTRSR